MSIMLSRLVARACVLLCFAVLLCPPSWAQKESVGGVLLSPTIYRVAVRAGQKGELTFTVANPGEVSNVARLTMRSFVPQDWTYASQYDVQHPRDASSWFAVRESTSTLTPGGKSVQTMKFSVPQKIKGSYWCVLQCNAKPAASSNTANIVIDVPVLFTVGQMARPRLKVGSPLLEKKFENPASPLVASLPLENDGEGYATTGAVGKLVNVITGRTVQTFTRGKINLFPGTKQHVASGIAPLPDGQYLLEYRTQLGSRLLPTVGSRFVVVKGVPTAQLAAALLELPPLTFDPAGISLSVPAGSTRSQSLRISNTSDREITIDIAPKSLEQTSSGILGAGAGALPAGLTAVVTPTSLTIPAKATATARVSLKADRGAQGDLWFGLSITERGNANALSETINGSLSVAGTAKPMLEVVNGAVDGVDGRPLGVRFAVRNTGNQALQLVPNAAVLQDGINLVARLTVPVEGSGGILPGVELPGSTMLPADLKPGKYEVEVSYQYGEELYAKLRVPIKVDEPKAKAPPAKAPPAKAPAAKASAKAPASQPTRPPAKPPVPKPQGGASPGRR